ncbi:tRNA-methyltransferase-domain-containing protein [Nemania serpens]|nr:tRNA-methyltransferase-domain-containing protein [Nemania serpens]
MEEASQPVPQESVPFEKSGADGKVESDCHADTSNISNSRQGVKRRAEDDLFDDQESQGDHHPPSDADASGTVGTPDGAAHMSKSKLKKLRRQQKWEEGKEGRRIKRRDKRHERQSRKRARREEEIAAAAAEGREPNLNTDRRDKPRVKVPVAIIVDCQYEKYMQEGELVSLSSQITRCYSDNKAAQHPVHLYISSYGGYLKNRNETVLENQHLKWKGVHLCEGDFVEVASHARESMTGPSGGERIKVLQQDHSTEPVLFATPAETNMQKHKPDPTPEPEAEDVDKSIVYLTADSPYTLDRLEPNTCYVVGGIIDKNREKGLCYRLARERNVRTAKLPIGEYMILQHRHVLATNHVVEIMLKWLETGDWGTAFMQVIPTRKGGKLRSDANTPTTMAEEEQAVEQAGDVTVKSEVQPVDTTQAEAQESPTLQEASNLVEVEGDNSKEGLTRNSLDEQRWSAPPIEHEALKDEKETPTNGVVS